MNGTTNHTTDSSGKTTGKQLDGSSGYKWNGPGQTGADPARSQTDRRQKREITGSCYDGTHHQCEQERDPVHSTGNVSHPRHSERRTFQGRTKSDRPDGANGPYTHEKQYLIPFRSQIAKKKDFKVLLLCASYGVLFSFLLFPFFFFFFRLKVQSWHPDRFVILIQCYHCKIRMIDRCTLPHLTLLHTYPPFTSMDVLPT